MQLNATANRRGTFRILEFNNPGGGIAYRVTGTKLDGQRIRENYRTHGEAVNRLRTLEIESANLEDTARAVITRLTAPQAIEAERAFAELGGKSMTTAVRFFLQNYREPVTQIILAAGIAQYLAEKQKQNLRPASLGGLRRRLVRFSAMVGPKPVSEIVEADCRDFVHRPDTSSRTQAHDRQILLGFFNWSVRRGYCTASPLAHILPVKVDREEPVILSLPEVRRLLTSAAGYKGGAVLPYITLALFCGIRPAELTRITWEAIRLDGGDPSVVITGKASKLRSRRVVALSANAAEWLRPFALRRAPIIPTNFCRMFDAVRKLAGFDVAKWIPDIMRHTAVTMHLAQWEHEGRTAIWAGNSPDIIQRHYKGMTTRADANLFWRIAPDPVKASKQRTAA